MLKQYRNGADMRGAKWSEVLRSALDHLLTSMFCIASKVLGREIGW